MDILIDNERMKSIIDFWQKRSNDLEKDVKKLSEENAKLKAENEKIKEKIIKLSEEKGHLIVEKNTLKEKNFNFEEVIKLCRCENYKQTLREIRAIAEMDICSNCITQKREDNCQCLADTILQKITKAEEE